MRASLERSKRGQNHRVQPHEQLPPPEAAIGQAGHQGVRPLGHRQTVVAARGQNIREELPRLLSKLLPKKLK